MQYAPHGYGTHAQTFAPKRRRLNVGAVCVNLFAPWMAFAVVYGVLSFNVHYDRPTVAWAVAGLGASVAVVCAVQAYLARKHGQEAVWWTFSALALAVAVSLGAVVGDANYWLNMQPYYDVEQLNTYPHVNPAREKGQQLMDAGRVYFAPGARLDGTRAMGFKNVDWYCIAPIVLGTEPLAAYDFWAVGTNCCGARDFRCGETGNAHARSGLRLMRDEQRPFFRLAVQQAEAAYNLTAPHPLFFYWLQDPVAELSAYREDGMKNYLLGLFTHFAFNLFCVVCAVVGFSRMQRF